MDDSNNNSINNPPHGRINPKRISATTTTTTPTLSSSSLSSSSSSSSSCTNTTVEFSGASWALEASARSLMEVAKYPHQQQQHQQQHQQRMEKLILSDFDLDATMAATVVQVLQNHRSTLKELVFKECSGHLDIVVTVALTMGGSGGTGSGVGWTCHQQQQQQQQSSSSSSSSQNSSYQPIETLSISIGRLATIAFSPCAHALGVGLQITRHLQTLILQSGSNVFFTLSTDAAISLEQGLAGNTSLKTLHIQSCRFGESSAVRSLSRGIRRQRRLNHVKFKSCFVANGHALDDLALAELLRGLEHNTQLTSLDISGNKCLQQGMIALASVLDRTKLQTLDMSCQCIDQQDEFMNLSLLVAALGRTSTLQSLELRFNKLSDRDMAYLSAALSHNTSIQYVGLGSNYITNTGISILASRIPTMTTLRRLVLTNNSFDEDGMLELLHALQLEEEEDEGTNDNNNHKKDHHYYGRQNTTTTTNHRKKQYQYQYETNYSSSSNVILESIDCDPTIPNYRKVRYYADLNWAGRRYLLGKNYTRPLLPALWSFVLARVDKKMMFQDFGKERQADILYTLLRHGPALFPM